MEVRVKTGALSLSLLAVSTIVVVSGTAGFLVNSLALMTDAMHALLDTLVTAMLLITARIANRPPDEDHTYGHGKMEPIGSFTTGIILLFFVGSLIYFAIMRITQGVPHIEPGFFGFFAAVYSLGVNSFRATILKRALNRTDSLTIRADLVHVIADVTTNFVVIGGLVMSSLGLYIGDSAAALVLGIFLSILSLRLIRRSALELSDHVPKGLVPQVKKVIEDTNGVVECRDLHIRKVGKTTFADVVIAVQTELDIDEAHNIASKTEARVAKEVGGGEITVHIEPMERDTPINVKVKRLISKIDGVKGLHNLTISSTESGLYITVHIQVDAKQPLTEAHELTERIETRLKKNVKGVSDVSIHLESYRPEIGTGNVLKNHEIEAEVKSIASRLDEALKVTKVTNYNSEDRLYIIINCTLDGTLTVEKAHETVSLIEDTVSMRFPGSIITVHSEPS